MPDATNTLTQGWVYLIVNDLIPNRVKIGFTRRDPIARAYELISTGTTGTFVVIYQAWVYHPYRVEQEVHRRFASLNRGLEWFEVCPNRAKEMIRIVAGAILRESTSPRWHPLQPAPNARTRELLNEARKAAEAARQAAEIERDRKAVEERAAKDAAEAARIKREREAEQHRRQREREDKDRREQEQAARAEQAKRKRLATEERERKTRLFNARVKTLLLLGAALLVFVPIVEYVTEQATEWRARSAAAHATEIERLKASLEATRTKLTYYREKLSSLKAEQQAVAIFLQVFPEAEKQRQSQLREVQERIVDHEEFLRTQPGAKKRLADSLKRLLYERQEIVRESEDAKKAFLDKRGRANVIPQEMEELHCLELQELERLSKIEREIADAKRKATGFGSVTLDRDTSR